ncbi:MAG TPA: hypothetical protein PLH94_08370 [Fimbriimonadaceae bacterium]|nr:hypothetical protein [Fimbriimonadaceae bacterium]
MNEPPTRDAAECSYDEANSEAGRTGFARVVALPTNVKAVEAALLFARGGHPSVALVGPSGWGKSLLLDAATAVLSRTGQAVHVVSVSEFLGAAPRAEAPVPLILDNVQDALGHTRPRQALRRVLERRVELGRPVLLAFTGAKVTRSHKLFLPSSRSWLIAGIEEPELEERALVVRSIAHKEGLTLAGGLVRVLARFAGSSGHSIVGACHQLKLFQSRWLRGDDVLRALGLLHPFLHHPSGWDVRDHVVDVMNERLVGRDASERRAPEQTLDLSAHLMLNRICLSERDVAAYLQLTPGEAYSRANRFAEQTKSPETAQLEAAGCEALLQSLEQL